MRFENSLIRIGGVVSFRVEDLVLRCFSDFSATREDGIFMCRHFSRSGVGF